MLDIGLPTLQEIDLLADCPGSELARLETVLGEPERIPEGATLCREGEPSDRFWLVIDGEADVTTDGRFVGSIGPGESVGEMGMIDGEPRVATVTAVTPMTTRSIARADFEAALDDAPALTRALLRQLSHRLRRLDRDHSATVTQPVDAPAVAVARPVPPLPSPDYEINVFEPGYFDDPYSRYTIVREHRPVYRSQVSYSWMVSRYEDVAPLLRDRVLSHDLANATSNPIVDDERSRMADGQFSRSILRLDAPDHTRLRRLVSRVFTPKAISAWRERATTIVDGLLVELAEEDEFDLISRYAFPIPVQIISELLGMPMDSVAQLRAWSHTMTKTLDPINTPEEATASMEAAQAMESFVREVIAEKRGRPDAGLLSTLIEVEDDGDRMTERELLDTTMLLYVAGHETTVNLIGNGTAALLAHPDQMDLLRRGSLSRCERHGRAASLRQSGPVRPAYQHRACRRARRAGSGRCGRHPRYGFRQPRSAPVGTNGRLPRRATREREQARELRRRPASLPRRGTRPPRGPGRDRSTGPPLRPARTRLRRAPLRGTNDPAWHRRTPRETARVTEPASHGEGKGRITGV